MKCKLLADDGVTRTHNCKKSLVSVRSCSLKGQKYPYKPEEVVRVLEEYGVKNVVDRVEIDNCDWGRLQGSVKRSNKETVLKLNTPSRLAKHLSGRNAKDSAAQTLAHEIAHLKGIRSEDLAEDFADAEVENVKKIIKNK